MKIWPSWLTTIRGLGFGGKNHFEFFYSGFTCKHNKRAGFSVALYPIIILTIHILYVYLEINEGKHSLEVKLSCDIVKKRKHERIHYLYFPRIFSLQYPKEMSNALQSYFFSFLLRINFSSFLNFFFSFLLVIFQLKSFKFRLNKSDSNSKKTKDLQPGNIS